MYSLPESPRTICTCGDEVAIGRVVPAQVEYRVIMSSLKFSFFLLGLDIEYFDATVFTSNVHKAAALVENSTVSRGEATVELHFLFNHTNIPDFSDSITVRRNNAVTLKILQISFEKNTYSDVELDWVNSILVSIESLHALAGTDIPHADGLVAWSRGKYLCIRLPGNGVYGVNVATVSESRLVHVQIPHLNRMVHRARQ